MVGAGVLIEQRYLRMVEYLEVSRAGEVLASFLEDFWTQIKSGNVSDVLSRYEKQTIGGTIVENPRFSSSELINRAA